MRRSLLIALVCFAIFCGACGGTTQHFEKGAGLDPGVQFDIDTGDTQEALLFVNLGCVDPYRYAFRQPDPQLRDRAFKAARMVCGKTLIGLLNYDDFNVEAVFLRHLGPANATPPEDLPIWEYVYQFWRRVHDNQADDPRS